MRQVLQLVASSSVFPVCTVMAVACPVSQVMAPLLDNNHELNWQANMVDAIERKTANQHTEGESLLAPLSICTCICS